jgi:hypothetical protein
MLVSILSIDPGGTTGYCYATINGKKVWLEPGELRLSSSNLFDLLERFLHPVDGVRREIIYEDFQFRQGIRTGLDLTPAKLIGVIEVFKEWHGEKVGFYIQQPSVQGDKAFFTNDRLKELGAYWPHGKGHARSATKHLLYWLKFGAGAQYVTDPMFVITKE